MVGFWEETEGKSKAFNILKWGLICGYESKGERAFGLLVSDLTGKRFFEGEAHVLEERVKRELFLSIYKMITIKLISGEHINKNQETKDLVSTKISSEHIC